MKSTNSWAQKAFQFFFFEKGSAIVWFFLRIYVGWQWFSAGWEKLGTSAWTGSHAGAAISGFLNGALTETNGAHPDVMSWYAWFINHVALPNAFALSYLVTFGEIFVGLALILGIFTGLAAGFGVFMNFNYLMAGTVSINPWLLFLQLLIIKGRKVAGHLGLDRFRTQKD